MVSVSSNSEMFCFGYILVQESSEDICAREGEMVSCLLSKGFHKIILARE